MDKLEKKKRIENCGFGKLVSLTVVFQSLFLFIKGLV